MLSCSNELFFLCYRVRMNYFFYFMLSHIKCIIIKIVMDLNIILMNSVEFVVYVIAFSIFVIANPYISHSSPDDIEEFQPLIEFYTNHVKGPIFSVIIQYSIVYWISRDIYGSLFFVVLVNLIESLITKKERILNHKERKHLMHTGKVPKKII